MTGHPDPEAFRAKFHKVPPEDDKPKSNGADHGNGADGLDAVRLSDVEMHDITWLWHRRLALGKITLVAGMPEVGKSMLTCNLIATVTTGAAWPDGSTSRKGSVIVLASEDGLGDTIRPRVEAAGGDSSKVFCVKATRLANGRRKGFDLKNDLALLERLATQIGDVALIVIDPITAYMGDGVNSHHAADVRAVLGMVNDPIERLNIAVWAITHPPKNVEGSSLNWFIGSQGYIAHARLAFLVMIEAETGRRLLLAAKANICRKAEGLAYNIEEATAFSGDTRIQTARIVWNHEPVTVTADEAARAATDKAPRDAKRQEAKDFLLDRLGNGPQSRDGLFELAEAQGIADRTLIRAAAELSIIKERNDSFQGGTSWRLPT